uniref:LacI family transcriptional regulator n=1 Tax=OCS116 cluster bacterium TaxID=2030921 RepID=A0A2A4YTJ0_9PROT
MRCFLSKVWAKQSDIVREAGVSLATVDRVLNGRSGVNVQTAKKVWEAIDRLQGQDIRTQKTGQKPLKFDVILPDGTGSFLNMLAERIEVLGETLKRDGITVRTHRVASFAPQKLAEKLREIGATDTDGIAVMPLEDPFVREAVNHLCDQGIPIVTLVSSLSTQRTIGHVGPNNRAAGRTAAHLVALNLQGKTGTVGLFKGSHSLIYSDHQERELGFVSALHEYAPNLKVSSHWEIQNDHEEAYKHTRELIANDKNVLAIYSVGSGLRGIGQALIDSKKQHDIVCVGHDLTDYSRELLLNGTVNAVIDQDVDQEAVNALQFLILQHRGGENSRAPVDIKTDIYLRDNLP